MIVNCIFCSRKLEQLETDSDIYYRSAMPKVLITTNNGQLASWTITCKFKNDIYHIGSFFSPHYQPGFAISQVAPYVNVFVSKGTSLSLPSGNIDESFCSNLIDRALNLQVFK